MTRPIAFVDIDPPIKLPDLRDALFRAGHGLVDIYDLPLADLDQYCALVVPMMADQEFLYAHRNVVRRFLDAGRILVFSGHLLREWIPGASPFVPKPVRRRSDYELERDSHDPIFGGLSDEQLAARRGVYGFFGRGHHPPPEGAQVILRFRSGEPLIYIDRVSSAGTILVHGGNDMLTPRDVLSDDADSIGARMVRWVQAEAA